MGAAGLLFTPGRVFGSVTTRRIIPEAYHLTNYQVSGGSSWLDSEWFDLDAKAEVATSENDLRSMLKTLLINRFRLVVHTGTKEMPVYALTVGKSGPKLREWDQSEAAPKDGPQG